MPGLQAVIVHPVLTHRTPSTSSRRCCAPPSSTGVRHVIPPDGLFIATIRPVEFWRVSYRGPDRDSVALEMEKRHERDGYAFVQQSPHYGDVSVTVDFLRSLDGWHVLGVERSLNDNYQLVVSLRQ